MDMQCCMMLCEEKAEYKIGNHLDPYGDTYMCEKHKSMLECDYCERMEEESNQ